MQIDVEQYRGKRICVALSGGVDSVVLLHLFSSLPNLSAVHVEHGIRGEASISDLHFCERLCKEWNIPLRVERRDVPALREGEGIEEAARRVRYEIFRSILKRGEADFIATAHHRDDVAETILFRLARGTSLSGMRTIVEGGGILRPLLSVSREEILRYAERFSLPFVSDSTNFDERFLRNYIRRTVLPAFEKIHPNAKAHLLSFAEVCKRDDLFLFDLAKKEVRIEDGEKSFSAHLPLPLFDRAALFCMDAEKDFTANSVREIEKLISLPSGKKICLKKGQMACREYDRIVFYYPSEKLKEAPFQEEALKKSGTLRADLDCFPKGCVVRGRREGDFFIPCGGKRKSLKKFFTDRKISARRQEKIPLVANGSEILAIFGVEISDKVKLTAKTVRIGFFDSLPL